MDSKTKTNEDLETLTCPITLQFFRDPVIAADGHAYERAAIVKWIETHGTSPLTREPLNVADLQSDEYLKQLASQRRTSTVSQIKQDNSTIISVISVNDTEHSHPADLEVSNQNLTQVKKRTRCIYIGFLIGVFIICLGFMAIGPVLSVAVKSQSGTAMTRTNHYYGAFLLNTSTDGSYNVSIQSSAAIFTYLYVIRFTPSDPWSNRITLNDNGIDVFHSNFFVSLQSYMPYILIVTTRNILTEAIFSINIVGSNYVYIVPISNNYSTTPTSPSITTSSPTIPTNARWVQNAVTVAGGIFGGSGANQLLWPDGLTVDDNQTIFVADYGNHRIVQWNIGDSNGLIVAGGFGPGNQLNQLYHPIDVSIDKDTDSLIICDYGNRRVLQWSLQSGTTQGEILLDGIFCSGLAIDQQRNIYVSSTETFEVTQYRMGSTNGTIVAGGYGAGFGLNQFSWPTYLFVDSNQNIYVSDKFNNRVMKWSKGAQEGIVVASNSAMTKMSAPRGLFVDASGTLYVVDAGNRRVLRWLDGAKQGTVVVGGHGVGFQQNQLNSPMGLDFDRHGNMYVVDSFSNRVQQFSIE
ncbi:unnamed protein product [Rotaria socialis]|uniref:U-box domain-containing protein n=1 Tax=Rotaria socialis TaxID=392032 RepID=A0A818R9F5_9BILA|nr:unnamed protein product [Rotaria socialis]